MDVGDSMIPDDATAAIRGFEDLVAWQLASEMTTTVYRLTRTAPVRGDRALCDQMQRSAVSVMSNIAEGYERGSTREYLQFLTIARASAAELRSLLHVVHNVGFIDRQTFEQHYRQADRLSRVVGGLRASIAERLAQQRQGGRSDRDPPPRVPRPPSPIPTRKEQP